MFRFISLSALLIAATATSALAEPPATIDRPKNGQTVSRISTAAGRVPKGHPVIVVRPLTERRYWVQPAVSVDSEGAFASRVYFGERQSSGIEFELIVLVAPSQSAAESFREGQVWSSLPKLPSSNVVRVVRD